MWSKLKRSLLQAEFSRYPVCPGLVILVFILMVIFGDFLAPHLPNKVNLENTFLPPFWQAGGSVKYLLGTDALGRDILSRIIIGARPSFLAAIAVLIIGGLGGTTLGIISGYYGGKTDAVIMRAADATLAFPIILLALLMAIVLGPSLLNVVIALSIVIWARFARVIRGEVLSLRERDFIGLEKVAGASGLRIIFYHIFPNIQNTLLVLLTLQVGWVIILEASLSFLGAGIPPPTPVWGSMVARGREYITMAWWIPTLPGSAIALVCLSFNLMGDWLREILDPKLRQIIRE